MPYRTLDAEKIIESADKLSRRVNERFNNRGIVRVAQELKQVAIEARQRADWIDNPHWGLRIAITLLAILWFVAIIVSVIGIIGWIEIGRMDLVSLLDAINNGVNDILLIGAGIFFLFTLENRIKRRRALAALHELRSLSHVIDMHQLTKDPERMLQRGTLTAASPIENMSAFELSRYLDYCSEMLSLLGKIAALYVQNFDDSVALAAVNEIEDLTTGLSRKIWQKIMILHTLESEGRIPTEPKQNVQQ
ncbi:MAG: hypothetical protein HC806_05305 [Anaerolineae bacterium]|nr:hypothetical protein [Anaerolineae bacterium]